MTNSFLYHCIFLLIGQGISERLLILNCTNAYQIVLQGDCIVQKKEKKELSSPICSLQSNATFMIKKRAKRFQAGNYGLLKVKWYNSENEFMVTRKFSSTWRTSRQEMNGKRPANDTRQILPKTAI